MEVKPKGFKYNLVLWFTYFETGYGKTGYIKIFIYLFGFGSLVADNSLALTFIFAGVYGIGCLIGGWAWFKFKFYDYQAEVGNQFNPLARELREDMKNRKV